MRTFDEQLDNIEALKVFKEECIDYNERKVLANVKVLDEDDDELFLLNNLEVHVTPNTNYYSIAIMWEYQLPTYKKFDLYGLYRTDYTNMEYLDGELTIFSNNRKIIIGI